MNSPLEPVSPSPSTPSSGSPPPDEIAIENVASSSGPSHAPVSPSQAKRRLATGHSAHSRDLKTRKRDDGASRRVVESGNTYVEVAGRERQREDLADLELMEKLKQGMFYRYALHPFRLSLSEYWKLFIRE